MAFRDRGLQIPGQPLGSVNFSHVLTLRLSELSFIAGTRQHTCSKSFRPVSEFQMVPSVPGQVFHCEPGSRPLSQALPKEASSPTAQPLLKGLTPEMLSFFSSLKSYFFQKELPETSLRNLSSISVVIRGTFINDCVRNHACSLQINQQTQLGKANGPMRVRSMFSTHKCHR